MSASCGGWPLCKCSQARASNQDACCSQIRFPLGHHGGEAMFVPRNTNDPTAETEGARGGSEVCVCVCVCAHVRVCVRKREKGGGSKG